MRRASADSPAETLPAWAVESEGAQTIAAPQTTRIARPNAGVMIGIDGQVLRVARRSNPPALRCATDVKFPSVDGGQGSAGNALSPKTKWGSPANSVSPMIDMPSRRATAWDGSLTGRINEITSS